MKFPSVLSSPRAARSSRVRFPYLLLCATAASTLSTVSVQGAAYYWDTNGSSAGAGATPTGTWGVNSYFTLSSAGTSATFASAITSNDTVEFVAGPSTSSGSSAYTVTVSGSQTAKGITFTSPASALLTGGSINLGSSGIAATSLVAPYTIASSLVLTASQTWQNTANGTSVISGSSTGTGDLTVKETNNKFFVISGGVDTGGSITVNGGTTGTTAFTGVIGSTVTNFNANGASGTNTILSGSNAYKGITSITSLVTLFNTTASTSSTGISTVSLGAGGIIAGKGRSTGALTVTGGGKIAPSGGTAIGLNTGIISSTTNTGTLSLGTTGGATLTDAAFDFNLSPTASGTNDQLATGALTLGNLAFNFSPATTTATLDTTASYKLIDGNGTTSGFNINNISTTFGSIVVTGTTYSFPGYDAAYSLGTGANLNDLYVTFTAVPEPSTILGGILIVGAFGWSQRRRFAGLRVAL